jgi:nucleoside-diphosphate kinase
VERLERENFRIIAAKLVRLTQSQAEGFYAVHRARPFFPSLTRYMTEGPVLVMVLEAEDAIRRLRTVMGATDPAQAAEGTIRKQYGRSIERNVVHGSDAPETARFEIGYFFNALEQT